jgi:hypothetical protein
VVDLKQIYKRDNNLLFLAIQALHKKESAVEAKHPLIAIERSPTHTKKIGIQSVDGGRKRSGVRGIGGIAISTTYS